MTWALKWDAFQGENCWSESLTPVLNNIRPCGALKRFILHIHFMSPQQNWNFLRSRACINPPKLYWYVKPTRLKAFWCWVSDSYLNVCVSVCICVCECLIYSIFIIKGLSLPLFIYKFIHLLIYLFLAALGLRCCMWAFSSCGERGYSSLQCMGFSLRWLLLLRSTGTRCAGFSSCGTWVQ